MDSKIYYVYVHTNTVNGKRYVGITKQNPQKRWGNDGKRYLEKTKAGKYIHPKFARAIQKYGWDAFDHIVWELGSESDMKYAEKYLIGFYNSIKDGYNVTAGGEHPTFSEESKRKASISKRQSWENDDERRKKTSDFFKTIPRTKEWVEKIAESNIARHPLIQQIKDGTVIAEYRSQKEVSAAMNRKCSSKISECLNNKRKTYLGYEWRYKK